MSAEDPVAVHPLRGELAPASLSFWTYLKQRRFSEAFLALNRGGRLPGFVILRGHHFHYLTPEAARRDLPAGEWCREAALDDARLWKGMHRPVEVFRQWLERGERAFLGGAGEDLATVFWVHDHSCIVWDQRCRVLVGDGTWYIRDVYTSPEFRARGFFSRLQSEFIRRLGVRRVTNACDYLNERANTAWKRSGWIRYGSLITVGLLGFKLYRWVERGGARTRVRWFAAGPGRVLEIDGRTGAVLGVRPAAPP